MKLEANFLVDEKPDEKETVLESTLARGKHELFLSGSRRDCPRKSRTRWEGFVCEQKQKLMSIFFSVGEKAVR